MRSLAPAVALVAGLSATMAPAHDFWVQPRDFAVDANVPDPMTIEVGHGTFRQRWSAAIDKISTFEAVGNVGTKDLRAALVPPGGPADATVSFSQPGTYVVVLETNRSLSVLPSIRFNDYIKAEGVVPAIAARAAANATDTPGRELYSRRAKALVRVGTTGASQPQVTRPVGLTLEIVPGRDPTAPDFDMTLPVTILYEGQPLAGAFVKLTNLDFDARPVATAISDAHGAAVFKVPFKGLWQMNVVWTKPIRDPKADFDTIFSSLTFGWNRGVAAGR